ncbi:MAG: holo-ACP synthase [Verrucomicrobia bacterium]|nr:holo-ACP synthase [Verrucomicrobiota bacterium]
MLPIPPQGGRVLGIGVDLTECDRIAAILERQGEAFLRKVFTQEEQAYCLRQSNPAPGLAARFAAKEAVSKCFGTGIGEKLDWLSIEVCKGPAEEPFIRLHGKGLDLLRSVGGSGILLSLSHTRQLAIAAAVLYA